MIVLLRAIRRTILDATVGDPPRATLLDGSEVTITGGVHVAHISGLKDPEYPVVTLHRLGGGSELPVAGMEAPFIQVETYSRAGAMACSMLYEWVSFQINMRREAITQRMAAIQSDSRCTMFYRTWLSMPEWDETTRAHYVQARYYAKAVDGADLHAAY